MEPIYIRLECLRMALSQETNSLIATAQEYYDFIIGPAPVSTPPVQPE